MHKIDRTANILFVSLSAALITVLNWQLLQTRENPYLVTWVAENYGALSYLLDQRVVYAVTAGLTGGIVLRLITTRRNGRRVETKHPIEPVESMEKDTKPKPKGTLRRLVSYVRPHWAYVAGITVSIVASSALDLAQPWIRGFLLFGEVITQRNLGLLPWVLVLIAAAFLAGQVTSFLRDYFTEILSQKTLHKLRYDVYQHLELLPMKFIDRSRSGELISRVLSDTDEVEKVMTSDLTNLGADFVTVIGSMTLLFYVGPTLAVIIIPVIVVLVLIVNLFKRKVKTSSKRIRVAVAELSAKAYEVITGIRIVKSFSREDYEAREFHNRSIAILKSKIKLARLSSLYSSMIDFMTTLALLALLAVSVPSVVFGTMSLGALVAFLGILEKMFKPLVSLSKANFKFQKAIAAGDRIFEIMDGDPEILEAPEAIAPELIAGRIEFDSVSFEYEPGRKVMDSFNLTIQPGETIAIVGPSGAGKSTVVNLLLRFYEPSSGRILIDNYLIKELKLNWLRRNIGLVLQEPVLFSGSVRDNIAYGNPGASDDDVVLAAKAANAHSFIVNLPEGFDTLLGERGVNLSVGQRQRVAIARALLKNPRILILDEATSNIDSESEALIQEAMKHLARGRTTIVIAHRLSTIIDADRIVVLAEGQVTEVGTHESLLQRNGAYAKLYDAQLKPQMTVTGKQVREWYEAAQKESQS